MKVTGKLAPSRIPRTGDVAKDIDCFSAEIRGLDGPYFDVQVEQVFTRGILGRSWDKEKGYRIKFILKNKDIKKIEFFATHFYGHYTFTYNSPFLFVIREGLKFPIISILHDKVQQWWFNSKTPERTNQIDLLKKLVEIRLNANSNNNQYLARDNGVEIISLLREINGERFIGHPEYEAIKDKYELILESLVESGDVKLTQFQYRALGKSLSTIAKYEQENRRHREQMQHNNWIKWLTFALVIIGCIQGFAAWNGIFK